jgi:hypothetical protein
MFDRLMKSFYRKENSGQSMLLMVLSIGATILGATTIAGILMVYQIKGSEDFVNSSKAIFAADAGTEYAEYEHFNPTSTAISSPTFTNGATLSVTCYDSSSNPLSSCGAIGSATTSYATYAISKGTSRNINRAFMINFAPTP